MVAPGSAVATDAKLAHRLHAELQLSLSRLQSELSAPSSPGHLPALVTAYGNLARLFGYAENNERYIDGNILSPFRRLLGRDTNLDRLLHGIFLHESASSAMVPREALIWTQWFARRIRGTTRANEEELDECRSAARNILVEIGQDQAALLQRLGITGGSVAPYTAFYLLMARTADASTRTKLAQAWNSRRDARTPQLLEILNRAADIRRRDAAQCGDLSVLSRTLSRSRLHEDDAANFIDKYLQRALTNHRAFEAAVRRVTGCDTHVMEHFPRFLKMWLPMVPLPLIPLDGILAFLGSIARRFFGVETTQLSYMTDEAIEAAVSLNGQRLGTLIFDLVDNSPCSGPGTVACEELTGELAVARSRVLCRYQKRGGENQRLVTFEAAHSIFHEYGHALDHVVAQREVPSLSGTNCLPVERLESLSSWFEKWIYHPDFAAGVGLGPDAATGLALCRRIKKMEFWRTNLERAVTAALDFEVYRHNAGGFDSAFERLCHEYDIGACCELGELLHHFVSLTFEENSGGSFAYIWGGALAVQNFTPFVAEPNSGAAVLAAIGALSHIFDADVDSQPPQISPVFEFYQRDTGMTDSLGAIAWQ